MKRVLLWIVLTVGLAAGASSAAFAVQSESPEAGSTENETIFSGV